MMKDINDNIIYCPNCKRKDKLVEEEYVSISYRNDTYDFYEGFRCNRCNCFFTIWSN